MLQLSHRSIVFVANIHVDFRKGIDGLIAVCRNNFLIEPLDGAIFLFYNRARNTIKILAFDGQGFWLSTKRLSKGKFTYKLPVNSKAAHKQICHRALQILINNGDPVSAKLAKDWRPLSNN